MTVCAVPALAGNEQYTDGFFYWSNGAQIIGTDGTKSVDFLSGHFPATISADDGQNISTNYRNFTVYGSWVDFDSSKFVSWNYPSMYVEVLFSVPAPLSVSVAGVSSSASPTVQGGLGLWWRGSDGLPASNGTTPFASRIDCVYDADYVPTSGSGPTFTVSAGTYDVERYFGYRYYFDSFSATKTVKSAQWLLLLRSNLNGRLTFSEPDYVHGIFNEVTVNTGVLQEINGKLTEIQTSTTQIQSDVSDIKNGLQDSNSSIWGAFKDSVSGLFVPSSQDLESVKSGFDQLAQDKLGGAYQSVDLVKNGVSQVRDKMNNPAADYSVEFPGIEVPLGDTYGTVRLIGRQDVTIPQKMRDVLYPIAGIIIPIVCTTWTVRLGIDMVNCFMSGMSYAEFLHRFTDEEDDEA